MKTAYDISKHFWGKPSPSSGIGTKGSGIGTQGENIADENIADKKSKLKCVRYGIEMTMESHKAIEVKKKTI